MIRNRDMVAYLAQGQQVVLRRKGCELRADSRCAFREALVQRRVVLPLSSPASLATSLSHFKEHPREGVPGRGAQRSPVAALWPRLPL
jgi:hypothetical protein